MKKRIALLLSILMLMTVLVPIQSFAAQDEELKKAIKTAKQLFSIPDDFDFDYNVDTRGDKTVWHLNWRDKEGIRGNVSVSLDDEGTVLSYHSYKPYKPDDYNRRKFPKISKSEARTIAEAFIKKVNPDILPQLKYQENNNISLRDRAYYINFTRVANGIPFVNNSVGVSVDKESGEVMNYRLEWTDNINFPDPESAISVEEAQKAYKKELGISLIYEYAIEDEEVKTYAVYIPKYNNNEYAIDAFNGKKVRIEGYYHILYNDEVKKEARGVGNRATDISLSPEELEEVIKASKLITAEEAEKSARKSDVLKLDKDYTLTRSSLSRSWPDKENFRWGLSFEKRSENKGSDYRYVSVTLDAFTGEIKGFYISRPYDKDYKVKYNMEESKAAVEKFLKEFKPERFKETEYIDIYNRDYKVLQEENLPRHYSFRYTRKVNGVLFPENGLSVGFDAVTGEVTSFSMEWFDSQFMPIDNAIDMEKAYQQLFNKVGLELQYKLNYSKPAGVVIESKENAPKVQLVYVLKSGKPYNIDAFTGALLDYRGREYKEAKLPRYTDIDECFAKNQIMALAEYGIYLEGSEFKPNTPIAQKHFFILLSKVLDGYYGPIVKADSSDKEIDEMYNYLIRQGIVKPGEKAPDSTVTREEGVKFIIRALNYDEVADLKGIYKTSLFKDVDNINPDLLGYVAIAKGLKIINGNNGYFYPKNNLTRAEAAVIIYNYLRR